MAIWTSASIRARVIAAVMVLTGLALVLSGVLIYVQGRASTEQRVTAALSRAADEVALLATEDDPETGQPFTDPRALLRVAMQRAVLPASEGSFAIVGDKVQWAAQAAVPLRPEKDADLVAAMLPLAASPTVVHGDLTTPIREYRYIVVPVRFEATGETGAMVRVADLAAERAVLQPVYLTYALVALGSLVLVAMLIWLFVGRLLRPVRWMRETAERITETDISERIPVRGNDDLSALAVTINGMLDRLEAAVGAQRDLLDDVGHELRTPLTIVRGHLELMDATDSADVTATRTLVLDELDRMRRLTDDLLTLAKAEQPDFITTEPTDIARLTDETLAKASGLGRRHWVLDELADTEVNLDPQRVAQAWLQLAANAVQYSADGSTIGMGSRLAVGELRLWVRDEGVGIPPEERRRILERKVRGSSGVGAGLGLAIVSSIAAAHAGRVELDSAVGIGSRFSIVIPVTASPRPDSPIPPGTEDPAGTAGGTSQKEEHEPDPDR